jgi:hypothetical protein
MSPQKSDYEDEDYIVPLCDEYRKEIDNLEIQYAQVFDSGYTEEQVQLSGSKGMGSGIGTVLGAVAGVSAVGSNDSDQAAGAIVGVKRFVEDWQDVKNTTHIIKIILCFIRLLLFSYYLKRHSSII